MTEVQTGELTAPLSSVVRHEHRAFRRAVHRVTHYATGGSGLQGMAATASRLGMIWVLIALAIVSKALYPNFFALANINNMFSQVTPVGIIALGMTFVIIGGNYDLSVAAVYAGASVFYADFSNHMNLGLAFALTVVIGALCGAVNGLVITVLRVNSFIATLATASLFSGGTYIYSHNEPIQPTNPSFGTLGLDKIGPVWTTVYLLIALTMVSAVVLARTTYGRRIYALGGNAEAARLSGMRTRTLTVSTFMITGAAAAVAGMVTASQIDVGQPNIGANITLNAIAIVIIGGTSLFGGEGGIWRTVIGIVIWATISNLFTSLALSTGAQLLMVGAVLLIAVAFDAMSRRLASRTA